MILGIDTSLGTAVGIVDGDGTTLAEVESADARGHAEVIGTLIEEALAEAGITPADVTHVAAGMGPGPFTGLRVGIAAARAFAIGRGVPVIPVPSHDAAAIAAVGGRDAGTAVDDAARAFVIVTDARRREDAFTVYSREPWPKKLEGPALKGAGADVPIESVELDGEALRVEDLPVVRVTAISGALIARAAVRRIAEGAAAREDGASAPLYLRAPDVTLPTGAKRVLAQPERGGRP